MTFQLVSTCHKEGWEKYGRRMVESFLERFPDDVSMLFFPEGFDPGIENARFSTARFPEWLSYFRKRNASAPAANGKSDRGYNFKFDAIRFAFKTAAVIEAFHRCRADWLVWCDADIFFHSDVSHEFLASLVNQDTEIAWLERRGLYPECGFYFVRTGAPVCRRIMDEWRRLLESDEIFSLKEWHDSYVFEHVVRNSKAVIGSLSGDAYMHSHPAINGPLGRVLDHAKGPRKFTGRTPARERRVDDNHPYWSKPA